MAAEAKSAADGIKLDPPVEPRPAGHIQRLPDDGLPPTVRYAPLPPIVGVDPERPRASPPDFAADAQSAGRMIARDLANSKHTLLKSVLAALGREDLAWFRDQIDQHLAEPTEEEDPTPFEFAAEPAEETSVKATQIDGGNR
jgi:hypothetical protein